MDPWDTKKQPAGAWATHPPEGSNTRRSLHQLERIEKASDIGRAGHALALDGRQLIDPFAGDEEPQVRRALAFNVDDHFTGRMAVNGQTPLRTHGAAYL